MRRVLRLVTCGAVIAGGTTFALASPAKSGLQPATVTAEAEFSCTTETLTVDWTLTVSDSGDGSLTTIDSANASPDFGAVTFTPSTDLEDGDTSTGTSTHPAATSTVALDVEYTTVIIGATAVPGETTVEVAVECTPEEPPVVVEEPPAPPMVEPTFTG